MNYIAHVNQEIRDKRMAICQACKWYKPATKSCGTLFTAKITDGIVGEKDVVELKENKVTHYKRPIRLCGCHIPSKVKYAWASCPADKWGTERLTIDELRELKKIAESFKSKQSVTSEELKPFFLYLTKLTGKNVSTGCSSCVRELIQFAIQQTKEIEIE